MSFGIEPAKNGELTASVKPPLPLPRKIVTLLSVSLVMARSGKLSLLKSAISTLPGALPTLILIVSDEVTMSSEGELFVCPQLPNKTVKTENANGNMFVNVLVFLVSEYQTINAKFVS